MGTTLKKVEKASRLIAFSPPCHCRPVAEREGPITISAMSVKCWDVFVCHAWEDKAAFVTALAEELRRLGIEVWIDEFVLKVGDSLRQKVEEGLAGSRFGIVVLSAAFFAKNWPKEELDGLFTLQTEGETRILPVWHNVTKAEVLQYSPVLAAKFALMSADGVPAVARGILKVVNPEALKLDHSRERLQLAASRLIEQLGEIDARLRPEIVIGPSVKADLDDLSASAKPGIVASIFEEGMRIDNKSPITGHIQYGLEGMQKIIKAQKRGVTVELHDVSGVSIGSLSKLLPEAFTQGAKVIVGPAPRSQRRRLNFRVTFRAGDITVEYSRIEFAITRPGTQEVELVSVAPALPFELRLVALKSENRWNFNVRTSYFGRDIRDILKANLALSTMSAGGDVELFNLDLDRVFGQLRQAETDTDVSRLNGFLQAANDVAIRFNKPLRWTRQPDEDEYFRAACLSEIVKKGAVELPASSLRLTANTEQVKIIEEAILQKGAVRFERSGFPEADRIFDTQFDVGSHFVYFFPRAITSRKQLATESEIEISANGPVQFVFPNFLPHQDRESA